MTVLEALQSFPSKNMLLENSHYSPTWVGLRPAIERLGAIALGVGYAWGGHRAAKCEPHGGLGSRWPALDDQS